MYWMHGFGGGWLSMSLFWGLLVIVVFSGIALLARRGTSSGSAESPLDILKKRYARGEIGTDEYERMKKELS